MKPNVVRLYWQATLMLLVAHLAGWPPGLAAAIALNLVQALHFSIARRGGWPLDVQVRWFYLGLLLLGTLPMWSWLIVLQTAGLFARLSTDYCLAARLLVLLPWNRTLPFSARLMLQVLTLPPQPGPITDRLMPAPRPLPRDPGSHRRSP